VGALLLVALALGAVARPRVAARWARCEQGANVWDWDEVFADDGQACPAYADSASTLLPPSLSSFAFSVSHKLAVLAARLRYDAEAEAESAAGAAVRRALCMLGRSARPRPVRTTAAACPSSSSPPPPGWVQMLAASHGAQRSIPLA